MGFQNRRSPGKASGDAVVTKNSRFMVCRSVWQANFAEGSQETSTGAFGRAEVRCAIPEAVQVLVQIVFDALVRLHFCQVDRAGSGQA